MDTDDEVNSVIAERNVSRPEVRPDRHDTGQITKHAHTHTHTHTQLDLTETYTHATTSAAWHSG